MKQITSLLLAALTILACNPNQPREPQSSKAEIILGELQHNFTLNEKTQEKFEEGLLLLHNFEYDDALTAFEAATAADSTEVMTHWGEAMCQYKALWRLQNTEKGKAILSRLGSDPAERLASIEDPIEKEMWQMIEIMYGEGEFDERNQKISKHLSDLHQQYPDHQEIAAFYALSLIWSTEEYGNGSDDLRLAAAIADDIIKVNPLHPGALHYKIHALDGPTSAGDAHAAADAYAKVAADAAHALHMPSHIYLALGEWEGVVNSNQVSYDASVDRMKRLELEDGARGYHSYAWLHYGLLQQGRYAEAANVLNDMLMHVPKDPTKRARGYLVGMQSRQLAESGALAVDQPLDLDVKVDDIGLMAKAMRSFFRAQLAFEKKEGEILRDEIKWLTNQSMMAAEQVEVIIAQMQGMEALLSNKEELFEVYMKEAVKMEEQTNYPAGPPRITHPSFEQYGSWLIEQGKYAEAVRQYDKALKRMPRRAKSLMGKMKALQALHKEDAANMVHEELESILAQADKEVLSLI